MKAQYDLLLESLTASLEAVIQTVELARQNGIEDKSLDESAYYLLEAGLKLSHVSMNGEQYGSKMIH